MVPAQVCFTLHKRLKLLPKTCDDEADAILATFDESSQSSPTAAECRAVARPVVIALRAAGVGHTP